MLWILASLFFSWLTYREIKGSVVARPGYDQPEPLYKPYLYACLILALLLTWPPFHYWRFERFLSAKATELADFNTAKVHCNTLFDTMLDSESLSSGHTNIQSGEIVFQHPWCGILMDYLDHPGRANSKELSSLDMFVHESMHVRGEKDEARTECQAVQRNYRAAKLLGVPDRIAMKNALDYYYGDYMLRREQGWFSSQYFSERCAPDNEMDEHLSDSTWMTIEGK